VDFTLTEDQLLVQKLAREFAIREAAPAMKQCDEQACFGRDFLTRMGQAGLLGLSVPARYGGTGNDYVGLGLACEELEYFDTALRVILSVHVGLNSLTLLSWGTEDQKERWLVPQARGEKVATFAMTEPAAGSDVAGIRAHAPGWNRLPCLKRKARAKSTNCFRPITRSACAGTGPSAAISPGPNRKGSQCRLSI